MNARDTLLSRINETLSKRNLKSLTKLGDIEEREIEIVDIIEVYDHSERFFTDIKFGVKFPNGTPGAFTVRFNANGAVSDGAVIVILVNGKVAIVKQWRLPLCRWTYEVPRGFGEKLDKAQINGALGTLKIGDLPLGTLARELGEEVMNSAEVTSVTHLGNIAENSGTSAVVPSFFLVQLSIEPELLAAKLKGNEDSMVTKLWDFAEVRREFGRKLCDNHTLTAIALAQNYIASLPRLG